MILAVCPAGHDVRLSTRFRGHHHEPYCSVCEPPKPHKPPSAESQRKSDGKRYAAKKARSSTINTPVSSGRGSKVYPL